MSDHFLPSIPPLRAALAYLPPGAERPYHYAFAPPAGAAWQNYRQDRREVDIGDARAMPLPPALDREGFMLCDAPSAVSDFTDEHDITRRYYPELAQLARAVTGAEQAHVFDHLVRRREAGGRPLGFGRAARGGPASANGSVHNDYTEASGRRRPALVLGDAAARVAGRRYAIVNIWRSIRAPVLDTPLAVCDARSVDAADLVDAEVRYPRRTGEIFLAQYAARHRWWYFSAMDLHEALVFKQYDSRLGGVARFTPHAAFDHPDAPAGAIARVSIEARCLVIYGEDA